MAIPYHISPNGLGVTIPDHISSDGLRVTIYHIVVWRLKALCPPPIHTSAFSVPVAVGVVPLPPSAAAAVTLALVVALHVADPSLNPSLKWDILVILGD